MGIFSCFSKSKKIWEDYLTDTKFDSLVECYKLLIKDLSLEKKILKDYYKTDYLDLRECKDLGQRFSLINEETSLPYKSINLNVADFIYKIGKDLIINEFIEDGELIILKCLDAVDYDDKHFILNEVVEAFQYLTKKEQKYNDYVLKYALMDFDLKEFYFKGKLKIARMPNYVIAINLLCKYEQYDKALEICDFAIENNIVDNTKTGYQGRKDKILKIINK